MNFKRFINQYNFLGLICLPKKYPNGSLYNPYIVFESFIFGKRFSSHWNPLRAVHQSVSHLFSVSPSRYFAGEKWPWQKMLHKMKMAVASLPGCQILSLLYRLPISCSALKARAWAAILKMHSLISWILQYMNWEGGEEGNNRGIFFPANYQKAARFLLRNIACVLQHWASSLLKSVCLNCFVTWDGIYSRNDHTLCQRLRKMKSIF